MGRQGGVCVPSNNLISSSPFLLLNMYFPTQSPYKRCFKESNVNLIEAAEEVTVVINVMNTERNDPSVWKELYEHGKQLAANVDNTQQHRANRDFKQATTFSRSLQVVYFVKCRQTHTHRGKKFVFICLCPQ